MFEQGATRFILRSIFVAIVFFATAYAACPTDVYCSIDGSTMMNSWDCHYNRDNHQVCKFIHNTYDAQGNEVQHYKFIDCGQ